MLIFGVQYTIVEELCAQLCLIKNRVYLETLFGRPLHWPLAVTTAIATAQPLGLSLFFFGGGKKVTHLLLCC